MKTLLTLALLLCLQVAVAQRISVINYQEPNWVIDEDEKPLKNINETQFLKRILNQVYVEFKENTCTLTIDMNGGVVFKLAPHSFGGIPVLYESLGGAFAMVYINIVNGTYAMSTTLYFRELKLRFFFVEELNPVLGKHLLDKMTK